MRLIGYLALDDDLTSTDCAASGRSGLDLSHHISDDPEQAGEKTKGDSRGTASKVFDADKRCAAREASGNYGE